MVICENCGAVLHEEDLVTTRSYVSDYMGGCYENITTCPCGGDIEEVARCELCGEYFKEDDLHEGVCDECLKMEATVNNALECGKDGSARTEVSVNGFLATVFTEEKIDEILTRELERLIGKSDDHAKHVIDVAETWCLEDKSYFAEWLKGRQK